MSYSFFIQTNAMGGDVIMKVECYILVSIVPTSSAHKQKKITR